MHDVLACIYVIKNAIGCAHVNIASYIARERKREESPRSIARERGLKKSRASRFRV